jgi:hypothetical protein
MPKHFHTPGTFYARHQSRRLAEVKAHQAKLGDAYRESNRLQMKRNRRNRRDRGQVMLPLNLSAHRAVAGAAKA